MPDLDITPLVVLFCEDFIDSVRHGAGAGEKLAFRDIIVLHRDGADGKSDVILFHHLLHLGEIGRFFGHDEFISFPVHDHFEFCIGVFGGDFSDPPEDSFLIEGIAAGEIEHYAVWDILGAGGSDQSEERKNEN